MTITEVKQTADDYEQAIENARIIFAKEGPSPAWLLAAIIADNCKQLKDLTNANTKR